MAVKREILEKRESTFLASYALKSCKSAGRRFEESPDKNRLCFQKDKERIIHSKAFRRLDKKTQVLKAGSGDHYRMRLTHTLEVAQISRDIARRLSLNEDLCEAIALAHDLGHPPFGHAGEDALNEKMQEFAKHFEHNEQSRRVVENLEKTYPKFDGLNLTVETLDGLIKHQTVWDQSGKEFEVSAHLEAQIVNVADEIAYTNHDIDDGIRSGFITLEQLDDFELWQNAALKVKTKYGNDLNKQILVSRIISSIISMMIEDLCGQTEANLKEFEIVSVLDVQNFKGTLACFSEEMQNMLKPLRHFLFNNFYLNPKIVEFVDDGKQMIKKLFDYYIKNSDKFLCTSDEDLAVSVKDYIAGMTDDFLIKTYNELQLAK